MSTIADISIYPTEQMTLGDTIFDSGRRIIYFSDNVRVWLDVHQAHKLAALIAEAFPPEQVDADLEIIPIAQPARAAAP